MELMESDWFFKMVEHQADAPATRLVAVFTVLDHWLHAPGIKGNCTAFRSTTSLARLRIYLINTARSAKVRHPVALANQLLILLQGAIAEELRDSSQHALKNAAIAAQAVIARAYRSDEKKTWAQWTAVASIAIVLTLAMVWQIQPIFSPVENSNTDQVNLRHTAQVAYHMPMGINPSEMEATLNLKEQFDRGACPVPHMMVLPPGQVTAYMNVVHFRAPDNPEADRANLHAFLTWYEQQHANHCYYAPKNGHTLVKWRQ